MTRTPAKPVVLHFGAGRTDNHREQVAAWVADNGVDPNVVPIDAMLAWADGQLTIDVYVTDAEGRKVIDPYDPNRLLRAKRTVPLRTPWPGFRKATPANPPGSDDVRGWPLPSVFVQWKGTDVCLDFHCLCGKGGHFHGDFAYGLRCSYCGRVYTVPDTLTLVEGEPPNGIVQNVEVP